jgi:predicted outer membrane repeat protein
VLTSALSVLHPSGNSNLTIIATVVEQCTATANGGAIYAGSGTFLTLINTQIRNNTAVLYGGGVDAEQNTAVFAFSDPAALPSTPPCSFDSNSISPTLGIGGALYLAVFASVWMDGCVLRNNSAFKGGGVYASPGTVNMWQSYAPRGLALYAPQALSGSASDPYWARGITSRVVTAYFLAVTINSGCIPYGVCVFNGAGFLRWEVYIDNSNVTLNTATSNGGAVYSDTDIHCAVVNSRVAGNTAAYGGGGVYVVSNQFSSSGTVWSGNAAVAYGGALYADTVPYASVNASTFQANTAGIGGGGIFVTGTALATVATVFTANTAAGLTPRGGACYARDSPGISFSQCSFTNNSAVEVQPVQVGVLSTVESFGAQQGGAVTVVAATKPMSVAFTGCAFSGNSADAGGAFAIPEAALAVNATFATCTFRSNVAAYQGGVFFVGNTSNLLVCNQSLIEANVANFGAVYASRLPDPSVSIDNSSIVGLNTATNYGPLFATVPVVFLPTLTSASATTRTGAALAFYVTMADAYGQTVAEWPDLKAIVTLPNNVTDAFVSGQASAVTLTNGSLLFSFLKLNGVPDATVTLLVAAESPSLPSLDGIVPLSVGISPCAFAEVFMPETLSCKCTDKSRYDADFGGCVCAYSCACPRSG